MRTNHSRVLSLCTALGLLAGAVGAASLSPEELLASSIARHDPAGEWGSGQYRLVIRESRPDGGSRETTIVIDNAEGVFELAQNREGDRIAGSLGPDGCGWRLNGSAEFSEVDRERLSLTCERLELLRNYYTYLWGLPMKLRDPGTRLGETVESKSFAGRPALELRVTYDEAVGSDVWYFYFDPSTHEVVGYRFYHDEAANDGEYIPLEGVQEGAGLRLPRSRSWYTHQGDELLGVDTLISIESR